MCRVWEHADSRDDPELTTQETIDLIRHLRTHFPIQRTRFVGGEPLLREDLAEIVGAASAYTHTEVVTNGTLVTERRAEQLVECGLHDLGFSIDGPEAVNDWMRGKGSFAAASRAIDLMQAAKQRQKKRLPLMWIKPVVSKANYFHLEDTYLFAKAKGVGFGFFFLTDLGRKTIDSTVLSGHVIASHNAVDPSNLLLDDREKDQVWSRYFRILRSRENWATYWRVPARRLGRGYLRLQEKARSGWFGLSLYSDCIKTRIALPIDPWGYAFPCEHLYHYKYGNCITDGPDVWYGAKRANIRELIKKGQLPTCRECNRLSFARMPAFPPIVLKMLGWGGS